MKSELPLIALLHADVRISIIYKLSFAVSAGPILLKPWRERRSQLTQQLTDGSRFSLELKPSLLRRLKWIAFKASPLMMAAKLDNGQIRPYRVFETTSHQRPLYPFFENNLSLKNFLNTLQGHPITRQNMGHKPLAIRFEEAMTNQDIKSSELIIEQPRFQ